MNIDHVTGIVYVLFGSCLWFSVMTSRDIACDNAFVVCMGLLVEGVLLEGASNILHDEMRCSGYMECRTTAFVCYNAR